ncbi:ABC transporter-like protein [Rhizobium grahamii CCGE 502]|uniref:ABC transporter-like protein n=1 Tax=Rhizobium grahamii CCGE 502 TaxID=990285 RepID=S3HH82_9HYPH|nr:ABC transporter-like protein [Rhizobium grahamii CCGE 502]
MGNVKPLLEIRGLKMEAQIDGAWTEIVHGVDIDLRRGEVLGLIGESGAGKSTIGLAAMGYARNGCRISGGSVCFDGEELLGRSETFLRKLRGQRIAYVAQSAAASFNPAHRLIDQYAEAPIAHGLLSRQDAERQAVDLYRRMRLPEPDVIGWRYPHQVSGGQLQRAMTAMAMACKPDLIIFDEPTTALDVTTQIEVLAAIRDAVRQFGTAAIYITHDLAVVAQMADRIKVLLRGREVEDQSTRGMLAEPKEAYTKSLWSVRSMEAEDNRQDGSILSRGFECRFGNGQSPLLRRDVRCLSPASSHGYQRHRHHRQSCPGAALHTGSCQRGPAFNSLLSWRRIRRRFPGKPRRRLCRNRKQHRHASDRRRLPSCAGASLSRSDR